MAIFYKKLYFILDRIDYATYRQTMNLKIFLSTFFFSRFCQKNPKESLAPNSITLTGCNAPTHHFIGGRLSSTSRIIFQGKALNMRSGQPLHHPVICLLLNPSISTDYTINLIQHRYHTTH